MFRVIRRCAFVLVILPVLLANISQAEIYKYKDEKGRWRFTDTKPQVSEDVIVNEISKKISPDLKAERDDKTTWLSLTDRLEKTFQPKSAVGSATLAVVKIETILGVGSGFFVSDSGYIITNKHVVRPTSSTGWRDTESELKKEKEYYKQLFKDLSRDKKRLAAMKDDLKSYKNEVENPSLYYNPMSRASYQQYVERYKDEKRDYSRAYRKAVKDRREFNDRNTQLVRRSLNSSVAQSFTIIFKDKSTAKAHLVKLSNKQDIAVLKLDGYITPFLKYDSSTRPAQAMPVYAIGSPLGRNDSVTSGIITHIAEQQIITDATILPGNSGGPLISKNGSLVGVNTLKVSQANRKGRGDGFGIAIPIADVFDEFGGLFGSEEKVAAVP